MEYNNKLFGTRLRELRAEKGIGQEKLAKELQLSTGSISMWENGHQEPTAIAIYKLSQFFGVTADYLLGLEE